MPFLAESNDRVFTSRHTSFVLAFPWMVYKLIVIARMNALFKGEPSDKQTLKGRTIVKQKLSGIVCHFYPENADAIIDGSGSIVE